MQQCIQDSDFGREQDVVCGWLYEWFRSDDPLLQRFVARFAPELAKRYMFHCLSTQQAEPVPGLEVSSSTVFFGNSVTPVGSESWPPLLCCLSWRCSFPTACHAIDARPVQEIGCSPSLNCPHTLWENCMGSVAHAEYKPVAAMTT